jgi:signal transduction histidine kinase
VLTRTPRPTLSHIVAIRMILVAIGITVLLAGFYVTKYVVDVPTLREAVLKEEAYDIAEALQNNEDPSRWRWYTKYPQNYGYRVFDHRVFERRKVISEANPGLLPAEASSMADFGDPAAASRLEPQSLAQGLDEHPRDDRWMLSEHFDIGVHSYWVQVVMIGDPNWQWREVIYDEAVDHVLVPVGFIVPTLTLAMFLVVRQSLRPLRRVAAQARALGTEAAVGRPLQPLADTGLPFEVQSVVLAVNTMLAKLQLTLERQKQFTSDAAHELRTPLAVLLLQIAQLPASPMVQRVREEIESLGSIVNQLLRLAQAEGLVASEMRPVDIAAIARNACEDLAMVAVSRRIGIEFDAPYEPVIVSGQAELLDVAARNLIDNALRHAPATTDISVTVTADGRLIVEDRGPGVPAANREHIFRRFWRGDRRRGNGAGIGLALVSRIAELHGGTITVEDRRGGGARFVLHLPVEPLPRTNGRLAERPGTARGQNVAAEHPVSVASG